MAWKKRKISFDEQQYILLSVKPKGFLKTPFEADKAGLSKVYKTGGKAWARGLSIETWG